MTKITDEEVQHIRELPWTSKVVYIFQEGKCIVRVFTHPYNNRNCTVAEYELERTI
jgi:hypothetical protein